MEGVNNLEELKRIVRAEGWDALRACSICTEIDRKANFAHCIMCDEYRCWSCAAESTCFRCGAIVCESCDESCGEKGCNALACYTCNNALEIRCYYCTLVCDEHQKNHKHA